MDNVESRARRGKSWRKMPVALCVTEVKCLVYRILGSSRRPRYRTCEFHGIAVCWKVHSIDPNNCTTIKRQYMFRPTLAIYSEAVINEKE